MRDRKLTIIASPLQKLHSSSGCVRDGGVWRGESMLPFLNRSSMPLYGEGTSVNRTHSRGIKEPLHWFVLEAVLLICLPMNECHGPVFPLMRIMALKACINWPDVVPREKRVWAHLSFHPSIYSDNDSHKNGDPQTKKSKSMAVDCLNQCLLTRGHIL